MQQQDTPVPHCRLFASYRFEMGVDLGAPLLGEGPGLWRERKIQPANMKDRWRTNLNKVASIKLIRLPPCRLFEALSHWSADHK